MSTRPADPAQNLYAAIADWRNGIIDGAEVLTAINLLAADSAATVAVEVLTVVDDRATSVHVNGEVAAQYVDADVIRHAVQAAVSRVRNPR